MVYTDRPAITFWSDYLRTTESSQNQPDQVLSEDPELQSQDVARTWFLKLRIESSHPDTPDASVPLYFSDKSRIIVKEAGYPRLWRRFVQFARDYEHHDFTQDRLLACGMRDWGKEPFGAAAWMAARSDVLEAYRVPRGVSLDHDSSGKRNVHVCGEAFSDYQGFIEGSLRSTRPVLRSMEIQAKSIG